MVIAALALGSNLGDRLAALQQTLTLLSERVEVRGTSCLYETLPMYVTDQPLFLNAALKISTDMTPLELLDFTQSLESQIGREKSGQRFGPRVIDIDILLYGNERIITERLEVPHPRMAEREFVLRPLCDVMPQAWHVVENATALSLLGRVGVQGCERVLPLAGDRCLWQWEKEVAVIGVVNVTPDSFSDGGQFFETDKAVAAVERHVQNGAHVVDIGGQSTAPNAPEVGAEEEIRRVVPVIRAVREKNIKIPISVDTFLPDVAAAALDAGANIVNDTSGGKRGGMLSLVAARNVPLILVHNRGNSRSMETADLQDYNNDAINVIRKELEERLTAALAVGIPRWNLMADVGIGYSKDLQTNLHVLRHLDAFTAHQPERHKIYSLESALTTPSSSPRRHGDGTPTSAVPLDEYPLVIGFSRKRIIRALLGVTDTNRCLMGNAAVATAAVLAGVSAVRVHETKEIVETVKVAQAVDKQRRTVQL